MLFYNKLDVILLATVFEKFRETCMLEYGLDPTHYISLPSFSFDAMLKMTLVKIELSTDIDKLLFCEKSIRRGVTEVIKRRAKFNNKYASELYDSNKKESYLMCFDVNHMYTSTMQKLPIRNFEFLSKKKCKNLMFWRFLMIRVLVKWLNVILNIPLIYTIFLPKCHYLQRMKFHRMVNWKN